jgi:N-methylhydantoinase A
MAGRRNSIRIAVDIGGTFTDGIAEVSPGSRIHVAKCLTTPDDPGRAVTSIVETLLAAIGTNASSRVSEVVHGTTLVTNTIIERNGARTALLVTRGTRDTLSMARETRYDLYDLDIEIPSALVPPGLRLEVDERVDFEGKVVRALDTAKLEVAVSKLTARGVEAVAVCFLHSYANPRHERAARKALARALPGVSITLSSDIAPVVKEYERMSTAAANAYVQPQAAHYLTELEDRLAAQSIDAPLRVMVSSGGFTSSADASRRPIFLLESGPAGGVLSAVNTAREAGVDDLLALDMGGTTAKACVATGGVPDVAHEFEAARVRRFIKGSGLPILIPSIDLIEIGAGGGSIARVDRLGLLNVGPESAGAEPGPACYAQGGDQPTVTDADLFLGFLDATRFLGGEMRLDGERARIALSGLARRIGLSTNATAWGIHNLVNENMASAARVHIAEKGMDPRRFTLVATGGAGPVHAAEVAAKLSMRRVLYTVAAGAGSCLGLLAAPARVDRAWSRVQLLADVRIAQLTKAYEQMHADALETLGGTGTSRVRWTLGAEVRYAGQGNAVEISLPFRAINARTLEAVGVAFEERYVALYGHLVPGARPEVVTWRLTGQSRIGSRGFRLAQKSSASDAVATQRRMYLPVRGEYADVPVYERYALPPGTTLEGPLVLQERESTIVLSRPGRVTVLDNLTVSVELA